MKKGEYPYVVDIGCGNGRNSKFMLRQGCIVTPLDMVNDYGVKTILGKEKLPVQTNNADIILCNYLMMFLNKKERRMVIKEIQRVSKKGCKIMLELYPAKDSETKNEKEMLELQEELFTMLGWKKIKYSKGRFIAEKL
jgi:predicted SAM-dependent methyltransferase